MPDPDLETRASIDRLSMQYRLDRELGRGGTATVWFAEDLRHGRQVAIKVLRPELSGGIVAERFLREIAIAGKLLHPRILTLIDSRTADGLFYYVMPYVAGERVRCLRCVLEDTDMVNRPLRELRLRNLDEGIFGPRYQEDTIVTEPGTDHCDLIGPGLILRHVEEIVADLRDARASALHVS